VGNDCKTFEIEIAAAGPGDLAAEVALHVDACPACRALREGALALARASAPGEEADASRARAIAARAARSARRPAPGLWAIPLLAASASAAALILYFGLFHATAQGSAGQEVEEQACVDVSEILPEDRSVELPDAIRAVSDLMMEGMDKEVTP